MIKWINWGRKRETGQLREEKSQERRLRENATAGDRSIDEQKVDINLNSCLKYVADVIRFKMDIYG